MAVLPVRHRRRRAWRALRAAIGFLIATISWLWRLLAQASTRGSPSPQPDCRLVPDGIATSPGTSADGSQIYVMRSDEAEARRLIASPDGDDRPVDREVAEEIIYRLCVLQQTLSRPLVVPFDEEFPRLAELQGIVGDAIGCIYTDAMMPFIEQYPDLDPDRGGLQRPADSSAGLEGEIDEARFATAFRHAAGAALRDLDALSRFVESREGTQAQVRFDADCDRSRQAIRRLLQRAKDVLRA